MRVRWPWLVWAALSVGCLDAEGDAPGECENAVDEDEDGLIDCADDGCVGVANCLDHVYPPIDTGPDPYIGTDG